MVFEIFFRSSAVVYFGGFLGCMMNISMGFGGFVGFCRWFLVGLMETNTYSVVPSM